MRFLKLILIISLSSFHFPSSDLNASFSCMINGASFSSNGSDGMANAAFKTAKDIITFSLVSLDPQYKGKVPPQISLSISPSGTSHFNSGDANAKYSAHYSPANMVDAYNAESGSATITSITASRIEGMFSGVFTGMGKTFKITDGKFSLPAAKYSGPLI